MKSVETRKFAYFHWYQILKYILWPLLYEYNKFFKMLYFLMHTFVGCAILNSAAPKLMRWTISLVKLLNLMWRHKLLHAPRLYANGTTYFKTQNSPTKMNENNFLKAEIYQNTLNFNIFLPWLHNYDRFRAAMNWVPKWHKIDDNPL